MLESYEDQTFEQLVQKIDPDSTLLRTWPLQGGVSAQVTALEIERPGGGTRKMVVRRHGAADLQLNPNIAADEFRLLQVLQTMGVAAPAPYFVDQSSEIFATPCVVQEYVEGKPEFAPTDLADFIRQFVTHLSQLHKVDCSRLDLSFLPRQEEKQAKKLRERPAILDNSLDEERIRDALEAVWPFSESNKYVLLHGDFWPGNLLWRDGRLVAVIDWEDAAFGDPLADVAISRLEILWAFGIEAMHRFTDQYRSTTTIDWTNLPYWDLCAALRPASKIAEWAADDITEQRMRQGHKLFVAQAFEQLSVR